MLKQTAPGSDASNDELYQIYKEKVQAILYEVSQKIRGENTS